MTNASQEVVTVDESLPVTVDELKNQIKVIKKVMEGVMIEDVHYGVIPGTKKKSLYKAGSETLLTTFRIGVEPIVEDLSTATEFRYRVKARGFHIPTGRTIGYGLGEASTDETKYAWEKCTEKAWDKTDPSQRRIIYGWKWGQRTGEKIDTETKQIRVNAADKSNTVLKMAKKRSQVDFCLTALAASDMFAQDLEDDAPPLEQGPEHPKAGTQTPKATTDAAPVSLEGPVTENMKRMLITKLCDYSMAEADFIKHFEVAEVAALPAAKINEAMSFIENSNK